ncbi:sulfatase-like hydrolase/transferase [Haladaptatus sp. W1]|uniref:sulfatase-like hydrolase/transferase n=1 Tax=Haladaptatus sp. W1 TaxID=1897478 RepID=UPI000A5AD665|nr:sulfatase-like hydrolase/transferase [Haladaptatus sp. W1]
MSDQIKGQIERIANDNVENVVLFICDSLRFDYTPQEILDLGISCKAISPSTFTASSLPSILTGEYPESHKVWSFSDCLEKKPEIISKYGNFGYFPNEIWRGIDDASQKPPLKILHLNDETKLSKMNSPFFYVEHHFGGHMVYGGKGYRDQYDSPSEFFNDHKHNPKKISTLYQDGVEDSLCRFKNLISELKRRGIYDETLVILTSDHGELLGEYGGMYGHGSPIVPELVEVPLVFAGAGLPSREIRSCVSSIDILPTAAAAMGINIQCEGENLWNNHSTRNYARCDLWKHSKYPHIEYIASSIWDEKGGIVVNMGDWYERIPYSAVHFATAPSAPISRKSLNNIAKNIRPYLSRVISYNEGPQKEIDIDQSTPKEFSANHTSNYDVEDDVQEQLEKLGYLE